LPGPTRAILFSVVALMLDHFSPRFSLKRMAGSGPAMTIGGS
jgi:hypothetical protein